MKTIFGLLVTSDTPEGIEKAFNLQKSLYKKISKTFEEFFIIDLINFTLFKKNKIYNNKSLNNFTLPHNFKVITPINKFELNKFLTDKNLVAFEGFGKSLRNFKIQFLIKEKNIRLIYLQNLGAATMNKYLEQGIIKSEITKNPKYIYLKLRKLITYFLIKIFIFLNLFSRIDIYFESNQVIVDNCNNSLGKKIEKIFPFLRISYFEKIIRINSRSFDMLANSKLNLSEEKIVFIDGNFDHGDRIIREGRPSEEIRLKYFNQLNQFLLELSNIYNKKITVCLHPSSDLNTYKKYLGTFEICKYQSSENIRQAFIVVFHESSIISDAIILKKKIISLKSKMLGKYYMDKIDAYQKRLGLFSYSLDEKKKLNKNLLQVTLEEITKNYDHYIKNELMADDSTLGEDKIINTVRKEYF
jgi:hypothetical protein